MRKHSKGKRILAIMMSVLIALAFLPNFGSWIAMADDSDDVTQEKVDELKAAKETAQAAKDEAQKTYDEAEQTYNDKKAEAEKAEQEANDAEEAAGTAEADRDNAFAKEKSDAKSALEAADKELKSATEEYEAASKTLTEKQQAYDDATAEKNSIETKLGGYKEELETAQNKADTLEQTTIPAAEQKVDDLTQAWEGDKAGAAAAVETAQTAYDGAGRGFINSKVNSLGSQYYDLARIIETTKTEPTKNLTTWDGETITLAQIVSDEKFEDLIDSCCTYDNLKKSIEMIKYSNQLRALPENNLPALKVSYQLMATAIVSNCVTAYVRAHTLSDATVSDPFWKAGGNSIYRPENLAYGWSTYSNWKYYDPFNGWYYKEKEEYDNGATNGVGHYLAIIEPTYAKATGFSYVESTKDEAPHISNLDGKTYGYNQRAAQEFNNDTSTSVTVDQYEQELDAYFETYKNALNDAKDKQAALESKPDDLVKAEKELADAKTELDEAKETIKNKNSEIADTKFELKEAEEALETAERELTDAKSDAITKESAKNEAETTQAAAKSANDKAQALDVNDETTYADYPNLKDLAKDASDKRSEAESKKQDADAAAKEASDAKKTVDSAKTELDKKNKELNEATDAYNKAADRLEAINAADGKIFGFEDEINAKLNDYRSDDQAEIRKIVEETKEKIKAAENVDEIDKLIKEANEKIAAVPTDAKRTQEEKTDENNTNNNGDNNGNGTGDNGGTGAETGDKTPYTPPVTPPVTPDDNDEGDAAAATSALNNTGKQVALTDAQMATIKEDKSIPKINAKKISTVASSKKRTMTAKWGKVKGATNHIIAYKVSTSSKWTYYTAGNKTSYIIKNLKLKGLYQFKLSAVKNGKRSAWTKENYRYFQPMLKLKVKAGKKKATVTWKKDTKASGYEIQYSLKKNMKGAKTVNVKGGKKAKRIIKGLKKGKKYYFKVRTYKTYKGKKYIGILSGVKTVKAK